MTNQITNQTWHLEYRIGFRDNVVFGVYACIVDNASEAVLKVSKHNVTPRNNGVMSDFIKELELFYEAGNLATIDPDDFGAHDFFTINGWDDEIVTNDYFIRLVNMSLE